MAIEQVGMFDDEYMPVELLFQKFNAEILPGKRYRVRATGVMIMGDNELVGESTITGVLVRHGNKDLVLSDVYLHEFDASENVGHYKEFVFIPNDNVIALSLLEETGLEFYQPYRIELEEKCEDGRRGVWLSCRYVGQTLSGQLLFLDYAKDKALLMLDKPEIKSAYPMSVTTAEELEQECLAKELGDA